MGSRRRREGGGQREEARITSYKQVGIIVSRMMLGMSTPQRVLHTVSTEFKFIIIRLLSSHHQCQVEEERCFFFFLSSGNWWDLNL